MASGAVVLAGFARFCDMCSSFEIPPSGPTLLETQYFCAHSARSAILYPRTLIKPSLLVPKCNVSCGAGPISPVSDVYHSSVLVRVFRMTRTTLGLNQSHPL